MEFEKNAPTTDKDVTLAEAARVTIQPAHSEIKPDFASAPALADAESKRSFDFETESTAPAATSSDSASSHPHHIIAIALAAGIAVLFAGGIFVLYLLR